MICNLHHVHLFASNLDESLGFYREMFGAELVFDAEVAGARNVLIRIGNGHINFYDQLPKETGRSAVHHLGIRTDNLAALVAHMEARGVRFRKAITAHNDLKYVMVQAPDGILIELFETPGF